MHEARFAEHVGASNPGASTIKSSGGPTNYSFKALLLLIFSSCLSYLSLQQNKKKTHHPSVLLESYYSPI